MKLTREKALALLLTLAMCLSLAYMGQWRQGETYQKLHQQMNLPLEKICNGSRQRLRTAFIHLIG